MTPTTEKAAIAMCAARFGGRDTPCVHAEATMSGQSASSVVLEVSGCARVYITDRCCL
jgi:hypothetical protein